MRADDDGFVNSPKIIQRMVGASDDDFKILLSKRFILAFDSGIIVIKHWRLHNYIRRDTYKETLYVEEKSALFVKPDGAYTDHQIQALCEPRDETVTEPSQVRDETVTQIRLDKIRLDKDREDKTIGRFSPPKVEEVDAYCKERNNGIDAEAFIAFYESKGWMVGKNKMKDWKAAVRTWEQKRKGETTPKPYNSSFERGVDSL